MASVPPIALQVGVPRDASSLDKVLYLFGTPIAHSLSPLFHNTHYDYHSLQYAQLLHETPSLSDCLALTTSPKFLGASVTMPFKVEIIPHLAHLTPEAAAIGAVNTIYWREKERGIGRELCGTNTDCVGVREAIIRGSTVEEVQEMRGRPAMVIGGGGTCRAAVYTLLKYLECSTIYIVNRDRSEVEQVIAECNSKGFGASLIHVSSIAEATALEAPRVVVSAIPDFAPRTEAEIEARAVVDIMLAKRRGVLLEMCYHPSSDTGIARLATKRGWKVVEGVEAMIWQGFEQDRVWLGMEVKDMPVQLVKDVIHRRLEEIRAEKPLL